MAAVEQEDPELVRAAQIIVSLRFRKLRRRPEWVPMQPSGEAFSSPPGTVAAAAAAKVIMPPSGEASSSARTVAARVVPVRRPPEQVVSMQSGEASFSLTGAMAAGVLAWWPKNKRSGSRGETTSKELPEQGHAAAAVAMRPSAPRSSEQERCAETPAASAQAQQPMAAAALCYAAVGVAGPGPSTTSAPATANKEPMKTPSPNSPLDYGTGAPSSADDAAPAPAPAPARPQAKRKGTGDDDEGCSSPAKRVPVAQEGEKPMPILVETSEQSETRAPSGKGAPRPFDLNLCPLDEDDDGCPDTT